MSTDKNGYQLGDEPIVVDGVTYYPFPDDDKYGGTCHECHAKRGGALDTCNSLPRGCSQYDFHWRTGFEAVVQWTARAAGKEQQHGNT